MIPRNLDRDRIADLLDRFPVVAILGARQVGKTTLAREIAARHAGPTHVLDLENPRDVARLGDPLTALEGLTGLVVLDEVQRAPEVFPVLRVLADRPDTPARFLVLGSASPDLRQQSAESLAGRIAHHHLGALALDEVGPEALDRLWLRGGWPRSFCADTDAHGGEWRREFVATFLERDLALLGVGVAPATMRRFWTMLAHYHAQAWNGAELARALGVAQSTVRRYLDQLEGTFVVRTLAPWHENLKKRQVRSPKVYVADSGLAHTLLGIESHDDLMRHPKVGASWEGLAIRAVTRQLRARPDECFFWATHAGAELDLLVVRGGVRLGFEMKLTRAPRVTRSMHVALADLRLDRLDVVHAGPDTYPLTDRVRAVALARVLDDVAPLSR